MLDYDKKEAQEERLSQPDCEAGSDILGAHEVGRLGTRKRMIGYRRQKYCRVGVLTLLDTVGAALPDAACKQDGWEKIA